MESSNRALHIIRHQTSASAPVYEQLIQALQHDRPLLPSLFDQLSYDDCQMALELILDWRIVRHYYERL